MGVQLPIQLHVRCIGVCHSTWFLLREGGQGCCVSSLGTEDQGTPHRPPCMNSYTTREVPAATVALAATCAAGCHGRKAMVEFSCCPELLIMPCLLATLIARSPTLPPHCTESCIQGMLLSTQVKSLWCERPTCAARLCTQWYFGQCRIACCVWLGLDCSKPRLEAWYNLRSHSNG